MNATAEKTQKRQRRHARIRARVTGTADRPRLAVFRSNHALYAQVINDEQAVTLAAADSRTAKGASLRERAVVVGTVLGEQAKEKGVTKVVFDRGGFQYRGVVAAFAESARAAGLEF